MKSLSELIESIKMDLGIYGLSLPIEDFDAQIERIIQIKTMATFSQFYPFVRDVELDLADLDSETNDFNRKVYILPANLTLGRRIVSIHNVSQRPVGMGYGGPDMMGYGGNSMVESFMLASVNADILSTMAPPQTFEFIQPNKLVLYNMNLYASRVIIRVATEHFENLSSIPYTAWESFEELALIDVKRFAYGILKHYSQITTAHGTIDLKIDDWSNAESERREIVTKWRSSHHLDGPVIFSI